MSRTIIRTVALASCLVFVVTACSTSSKVDATSAETSVAQAAKAKVPNGTTVTADCPGGVKAKKGETFQCTVNVGGQTTKVNVSITDVKDKHPLFKLEYTQAIISTVAYAKALQNRLVPVAKRNVASRPSSSRSLATPSSALSRRRVRR